jgi:hypothetical protein
MKLSSPKAINWTLKQYGYMAMIVAGQPQQQVKPQESADVVGLTHMMWNWLLPSINNPPSKTVKTGSGGSPDKIDLSDLTYLIDLDGGAGLCFHSIYEESSRDDKKTPK